MEPNAQKPSIVQDVATSAPYSNAKEFGASNLTEDVPAYFLVWSITALPVAYHALLEPVARVSLYVSSRRLSAVSQFNIASCTDSTLLPATIVSPELSLETTVAAYPIPFVSDTEAELIIFPVFQEILLVTDCTLLKSLSTLQERSILPNTSNLTPPFLQLA